MDRKYTQREFLKIIEKYNSKDNRQKIKENFKTIKEVHKFQNRDITDEMGFAKEQVSGWFNKSNPVIPLFEDALEIAEHFEFSIDELINSEFIKENENATRIPNIHRRVKCNTNTICNVEGCNEKSKIHGMCDKHYSRIRRNGDLILRQKGRKKSEHKIKCLIEGCDNVSVVKGMCKKHYTESYYRLKHPRPKQKFSYNKDVILNYREEGKTFAEIGKILKLSKQRVHQVYTETLRKCD